MNGIKEWRARELVINYDDRCHLLWLNNFIVSKKKENSKWIGKPSKQERLIITNIDKRYARELKFPNTDLWA